MILFDTLYNEFAETKNGNVFAFCQKYKKDSVATRFLLIRSFDSDNLKKLLEQHNIPFSTGKEKELMNVVYRSDITINNLLDYIESKRAELISEREKEVDGLESVLKQIPIVGCGVRNDNVDTIIQSFTRNKNIKSYDELIKSLDSNILSRIKQYCLWSYYNQTSNDIIELIFLKHKNVIPTLRKIYNIDFFLKIDTEIIPFDLKITHISDDYFELASKGISPLPSGHDDFSINENNPSELELIKAYYKDYRKKHKELTLPNIGTFKTDTKSTLSDFIFSLDDTSRKFIVELQHSHEKYVPNNQDTLKMLEWWNYKYQGERLFCNNNRFFVFLAYKNKFIDGRELKGNITAIEEKITTLLDNLTPNSIHKIKYHYDKEAKLEGDYFVFSLSTIYTE